MSLPEISRSPHVAVTQQVVTQEINGTTGCVITQNSTQYLLLREISRMAQCAVRKTQCRSSLASLPVTSLRMYSRKKFYYVNTDASRKGRKIRFRLSTEIETISIFTQDAATGSVHFLSFQLPYTGYAGIFECIERKNSSSLEYIIIVLRISEHLTITA